MAKAVVPGTTVCLLSNTKKMPTQSFSLPAGKACPGAFYGVGAICEHCYAMKGSYVWECVKHAQETRFQWVLACQRRGADGTAEFVRVMRDAIAASVKNQKTEQKYFRVHDSGDLFSPWYIDAWINVCEALPYVKFWFPTRSWRLRKIVALQEALLRLSALPNVALKPSAIFLDTPAPRLPGHHAGTGVTALVMAQPMAPSERPAGVCPSLLRVDKKHPDFGKCLDCRACWGKSTEITYVAH